MQNLSNASNEKTTPISPFEQTFRAAHRGAALIEADHELTELLKAVRATGRPGELTLTLKIKPLSGAESEALNVVATVKAKSPKADRPASIFFCTPDFRLTRHDPRQLELPPVGNGIGLDSSNPADRTPSVYEQTR